MSYEHEYFSLYLWHTKSQHKEYLRALHPDSGNEHQPTNQPTRCSSLASLLQNATPKITGRKSNEVAMKEEKGRGKSEKISKQIGEKTTYTIHI